MPLDLPVEFHPNLALFAVMAGIAAIAAIGVVAFGHAVRSALCLVLNFFILAILYFTLNAEMIGITQIVVYMGAIMVLFLFVIMLLNTGGVSMLGERRDPKRALGYLFGLGLFAMVASQVLAPLAGHLHVGARDDYGTPWAVGRTLFTQYVFPFEVVGVLLFIGLVGSILLAKRRM
jgi:NADH-quinone oxidoreductase subunit J